MANNMIELIASLNTTKSVSQIKTDIGEIAKELASQKVTLPIQCNIDTNNIKALQTQLNGIANNLKLNVGVNAQSVNKQGNTTTTEIKVNAKNAESQITELSKIVQEQLGNKVHAVLDDLVSGLKTTLGESSTVWTNWTKEADGALSKFSVSVKNAKGELTQLNYLVGKNGEIFLANSTGTDKGKIQQQKEILSLAEKINDLQAKNKGDFSTLFSGEIVTFESLNKELEKLKNGEGNIESVHAKFVALKNEIETIKASVRGAQGKSLNVFDNANINAKEFDNTLKKIDVDIKNLNGFKYTGKSTDIKSVEDLRENYNSLKKTIKELNEVEQSQRGNKWYKDYVTASEKLRQLQSDIKLLNKLKKEDSSSGTVKQLEGLAKIQNGYREIQKLEKQRYSAGQNELNYINQLKGANQRSINAAKNKLEKEGLLTKEIQKQIDAEEAALKKVTERARRKELDKQATKEQIALEREQIALEREQNNKRSQYMSDITSAYSRMNAEYSKLYGSKSSEDEKKAAQERINWNQEIIDKSIQALETENIITQRNRDKIAQLKEINLQKQEAASLDSINKRELEDEKIALSAINKIYSERSKQFKTLFSSSSSESDKIFAQKQLDELTTWLARIKEAFTEEGKINERIKDRIELRSEELQKELEQLNIKKQNEQAEQKAAQAQAKLNAEIASQTQTTKSAISELDKIINNSDKVLKSKNELTTSIGITNTIENLRTEFERTIEDAKALKQVYQEVSKTIGQDNSDKAIQKTNEDLRLMKTELSDIDKKVKDTQLLFEQLNVIAGAWKKIELYNSKLSSGNLTTEDVNRYNKQIEAERNIAIQARQKLKAAGLYTSEIEKQTNYIKAQSESIIKERQDQQKSSEQEAKNAEILKTNLKSIERSYKKIADLTKIIKSNETTDSDKAIADNRLREQYKFVDAARARLQLAGLYNDQVQNEIKQGQKKIKQAEEEAQLINENIQKTESLRQQEAEYKKLTQIIDNYIKTLSSFNNSNLAIKNNNDSRVSAQVASNNNLLSQLNTFSQSLKSDSSATNVERISKEINNLTTDLQKATDSSKQLNQALKSENTEARFARNLQTITNRVELFAATNRKAITSMKTMRNGMTFADEWNRIVTTLRSGNLDGSAIEKLTADFRNFKSEADAAGMTTSRFFNSMNSQLKMVLQRWVSLYAVIGYIRKMIDNVKELDTAMINLKRVTSGTTEEYEKFLEKANAQAKVLRTTTSSLTEQAYQWAKLGYDMNDALDLSEASTIFTKVADIDESQAINNMITALKAFNMTAEQSMDVVDKLDILNNKYAVSAAGLGEGLERAASSLALTGNSLEQTLAMLTGASEITQNVENTANGIRILSLR